MVFTLMNVNLPPPSCEMQASAGAGFHFALVISHWSLMGSFSPFWQGLSQWFFFIFDEPQSDLRLNNFTWIRLPGSLLELPKSNWRRTEEDHVEKICRSVHASKTEALHLHQSLSGLQQVKSRLPLSAVLVVLLEVGISLSPFLSLSLNKAYILVLIEKSYSSLNNFPSWNSNHLSK